MRAVVLLCLLGTACAQDFTWGNPTDAVTADACLTDQTSCGCCMMQQQFSKLEMYFNMGLEDLQTSLNSTITMLNNYKASRCAFSVALTNVSGCLGPFREVSSAVYKAPLLNLCNGYSVTTGIFTVPRSGVYVLALTVYSDSGSPGNSLDVCANLVVNGAIVAMLTDRNMQDQEDSATSVVAMKLSARDKVWVTLPIGCFLCDNNSHRNTFSGFLLYATN